ncbi:PREDICTED: random slug protein 5-like isoform X2 [Tarenaya hassleriana]|uniref:random slug protein 5-like isoform X1 n=1 Tax=Tarenaya hassleriana TaxID=28532 RepID=UPI00053CA2B0|nr:PREDICTED: random slug protein 5-like isoform X1 [Tarenaya hassleriana]XP_019059515.1 PREDICTED: random slug protein 5-like isoform X2 [Tarenaya hassleriana]
MEEEIKSKELGLIERGKEIENGPVIEDEIERSKVGIMRALCEREDQSTKDVDDLMLRRFLRARNHDIEKASTMFLKYLNWKRTFLPNGYISESEITNELSHNKTCMAGRDKRGRPVVVIFGNRHNPSKGNPEEFKRFLVYTLQKIADRMPRGEERFIAIGDLQGWGYSNCDVRGYLASLSILQDYHPERLGKLCIVHAPYVFLAAWKIIYPFIDCNTKKKIVFVEDKKLASTLLEDMEEDQLPDIYGGKLPLVPIQDSSK